jgi:Mycobacterium membrane protein
MIPTACVLKRAWIPLVLVVVLTVSGLVTVRLHEIFGSQDLARSDGLNAQTFCPVKSA